MASSPLQKHIILPAIQQPKTPQFQGHKLEWPTDSMQHSTQLYSYLQNALLSRIVLLQEFSFAWNKPNNAFFLPYTVYTIYPVHSMLR